MARRVFLAHFYIPETIFSQVMKQKPSKPLNYEKAARSHLRLVQCVAAGGIGWQLVHVESAGNRWNQLEMVKNCISTKFSLY